MQLCVLIAHRSLTLLRLNLTHCLLLTAHCLLLRLISRDINCAARHDIEFCRCCLPCSTNAVGTEFNRYIQTVPGKQHTVNRTRIPTDATLQPTSCSAKQSDSAILSNAVGS